MVRLSKKLKFFPSASSLFQAWSVAEGESFLSINNSCIIILWAVVHSLFCTSLYARYCTTSSTRVVYTLLSPNNIFCQSLKRDLLHARECCASPKFCIFIGIHQEKHSLNLIPPWYSYVTSHCVFLEQLFFAIFNRTSRLKKSFATASPLFTI